MASSPTDVYDLLYEPLAGVSFLRSLATYAGDVNKMLRCGHCLADDHEMCMGELCMNCEVCAATLAMCDREPVGASVLVLRSTTEITPKFELVDVLPDPFRWRPSIAEQLVSCLDRITEQKITSWVQIAEVAAVSTAHGVKDRLDVLRPGFEFTTRRLQPGSGNRIPTALYARVQPAV